MKECAGCAMCCKLLDIPGFAASGIWCPHAAPGSRLGCTIYSQRPKACMDFGCLWKQSDALGNNFRPDHCGIIFELYSPEKFVVAMVDKYKADAWKKNEPRKLILQMLKDGYFVWAVIEKERHLLLPKDISEAEAKQRSKIAWKRKMETAA